MNENIEAGMEKPLYHQINSYLDDLTYFLLTLAFLLSEQSLISEQPLNSKVILAFIYYFTRLENELTK